MVGVETELLFSLSYFYEQSLGTLVLPGRQVHRLVRALGCLLRGSVFVKDNREGPL